MFSRIVLVCTIISLLACPLVVSQQDSEEQLEKIDSRIASAKLCRNIGIGLVDAGVVCEVVALVLILRATRWEGISIETDWDLANVAQKWQVAGIAPLLCGGLLWMVGKLEVRRLESMRKTIAIRVQPYVTRGDASIGLQASLSY